MRPNRSEVGEKKGIAGRHTAHSIEIQNRRGLSLYKLKRNRATVSFTFSFYQPPPPTPSFPVSSIPRVSSDFFPPVFGGGEAKTGRASFAAARGNEEEDGGEGMEVKKKIGKTAREEDPRSLRSAPVKRGLKLHKTLVRKWRSGIESAIFIIGNPSLALGCMK